MKTVRLFGIFVMMLVFSQPVWAGGLRSADVKGFVRTMTELKPYFDTYADEVGDDGDASSTAQLVKDWSASVREQQEIVGVLAKNGFTLETWSTVSQQVMQAYMAVKFGKDGKNVPEQMKESLRSIESNPDIPEGQKVEIRKQMQQSIDDFEKTLNATKEDQDAVRPHLADLDAIFEWEE